MAQAFRYLFERSDNPSPSRHIRLVVISMILLAAVVLGATASPKFTPFVIAGIAGILAFLYLLPRLEIGLYALVLGSLFIPFEIGTGTNVSLNAAIGISAALIGIWLLRMLINEKRVRIAPSQINLPALLFIASVTISLVAGNINWVIQGTMRASTAAQLGGWMLYVFPVALMLFTMNQVKEIKVLRTVVYLFLGGSMLYALSFFVTPLSRIFTTGGFSAMFWLWAPVLALGQTIFNDDLSWQKRAGFGLLGLIIIILSWSFGRQEWVSGWLPAMVALIVMVWLRSWRFGTAATAFGVLVIAIFYTTLQSSLWTSTQQYSTTSRFETYPIMFELIKANPLVGLGMGNYHFYTPLYSLMGWHVQFNSHNQYIDILAQTGIAGMSFFLWLVVALGLIGMRQRSTVQDGFSKGYIAAVLGGLVGMLASGLLGDWFLPFLYNVGMDGFQAVSYTWVFIGGIGAIEQLNRRAKPE